MNKKLFLMQVTELSKIYETVLSSPGMSDSVKINLKIQRKDILVLTQVIERGLAVKDEGAILPGIGGKDSTAAIQEICKELLQKSGLAEMKEKLNAFQTK